MRKRSFYILSILSCLATAPAMANWQYPGTYVGDGWYEDDGSRFVISARGGMSFGMASVKNEVGAIANNYYASPDGGTIVSETYYYSCIEQGDCEDFVYAGYGYLNELPVNKDFESFSFAAGASIGWTMPNKPQWRIEVGYDHISKSEYNASPMYEGDLNLTGGALGDITIYAQSATVNSKIKTDIVSAMAFYDFFDGIKKPINQIIPYVGFGIGYADSETTLILSDPYGDLSAQVELQQYGELDDYGVVQFYRSKQNTTNVAGLLSAGISYGITETMFLDFNARLIYLPKVKWELTNEAKTRTREWFSAENMFYANLMIGIRFEF